MKLELRMLVKDVNVKCLVTGDKQGNIKLETLYPADVNKIAQLAGEREIKVTFSNEKVY